MSIITTSPGHEAEHGCFYWQRCLSDLHNVLTNVGLKEISLNQAEGYVPKVYLDMALPIASLRSKLTDR